MAYIEPSTVNSPKASWRLDAVIHNTGQGGWSAAEGEWEGASRLAVRWNGSDTDEGVGNPQSRGHATWFILPEELEHSVRTVIQQQALMAGVRCVIGRPSGYELGAWQVTVTLPEEALVQLKGEPLPFTLPSLPHRMCHPEKGYVRATQGELKGCFIDGSWLGDMYSNGIPEGDNPTKIEAVRDAFLQSAIRALQQAGLFDKK